MEGTHADNRHAYSPLEDFVLRDRDEFIRHGRVADKKGIPQFGVFGSTQSLLVFPTIPLGAPIDYMHQVRLNVFRSYKYIFFTV